MKTINKGFGIICLMLFTTVGVYAQEAPPSWKYPKVENGNTIVSRDAAGGIKTEALLTPAQKAFLMNQTSQPQYDVASEYNKVSEKFQVASNYSTNKSTWTDAYNVCLSYSQQDAGAGSWRLPTQRELMLIWMFNTQLTACNMRQGLAWSGTKTTYPDQAYVVHVSTGYVDAFFMSDASWTARCVRDLP